MAGYSGAIDRKTKKMPGEKIVKDIKRATRKHCSSEEKIRIILDGLCGEGSIAEPLARGIAQISSRPYSSVSTDHSKCTR